MRPGLLVDTQVLVWMARDPRSLGRLAARTLRDSAAVHYSSISIAELHLKAGIGKFTVSDDFVARLKDNGLHELVFAAADAVELQRFPGLARHDPFDRFILAQASTHRLQLMTADRVVLALNLDWVIDARV